MGLFKKAEEFITTRDEIAPPGYSNLHFHSDEKQKTFFGGFISFGVTLYTLYIAYARGRQMLEFDSPATSSIAEVLDYEAVGRVGYTELALLFLEVVKDGDYPVDLDALDYKRYIHIRYKQIEKKFVDGVMSEQVEYFEYHKCTEANYQKSEYSKKYYDNFAKDRAQYCVNEDHIEKIFFKGTRDSVYIGEDSAYGITEILKCTEESRLPGYPECATDPEISEFLQRRRAFFKIISEQVDFNDRSEVAIRSNEIYTPSMPL